MANKDKAEQIVGQFPWGWYITEELRPQISIMVKMYLEADTFEHALESYNKFINAYYYSSFDRDIKKGMDMAPVSNWYFEDVAQWKDTLNQAWLEIHGLRHTREEVMKIAADFWCERIFDRWVQNAGADSEASVLAMALAAGLKSDSMERQSSSVRDKAWYLIAEFYGKVFDKDPSVRFADGLYVDYDPSQILYDILVEAGVRPDDVQCIVPYKTSLALRDFDKSLVGTSGYRNFVDL